MILVGLLWGQARYRLTLYPHPSLFALSLGAFIIDEIAVLLLARAVERGTDNAPAVPMPALSAAPARRRRHAALRPLASFALVALPLLVVFLFLLLARYRESGTAAGGGLTKPTLFRFDFSQLVRLESEISTTDDTVLLLRVDGEADTWLLRRFVLSGYDPRQGFFIDRGRDLAEHPADDPRLPRGPRRPGLARPRDRGAGVLLPVDRPDLAHRGQPARAGDAPEELEGLAVPQGLPGGIGRGPLRPREPRPCAGFPPWNPAPSPGTRATATTGGSGSWPSR